MKRKLISIVLVLAMVLALTPSIALAAPDTFVPAETVVPLPGDGSEANPYLINNYDDLMTLQQMIWADYIEEKDSGDTLNYNDFDTWYALGNDIELTPNQADALAESPIGYFFVSGNKTERNFISNFDGKDYTISGLKNFLFSELGSKNPSFDTAFTMAGYEDYFVNISNLSLEGDLLDASGLLAKEIKYTKVTSCAAIGTLIFRNSAENNTKIRDLGLFAQESKFSVFKDCKAEGDIASSYASSETTLHAGLFTGRSAASLYKNCTAIGNVVLPCNGFVALMTGFVTDTEDTYGDDTTSTYENCTISGTAIANKAAMVLTSEHEECYITDCQVSGTIVHVGTEKLSPYIGKIAISTDELSLEKDTPLNNAHFTITNTPDTNVTIDFDYQKSPSTGLSYQNINSYLTAPLSHPSINVFHVDDVSNYVTATSFGSEGFQAAFTGAPAGTTITPTASFTNQDNTVKLTYTLNAPIDQPVRGAKLAIFTDVQIGENDYATLRTIESGGNVVGLALLDDALDTDEEPYTPYYKSYGKQLNIYFNKLNGTTPISTYWFGSYDVVTDPLDPETRMYDQLTEDTKDDGGDGGIYGSELEALYDADSGIAFSWHNIDIEPGESKSFSFLVGIGAIAQFPPELVDATITPNGSSIDISANAMDIEDRTVYLYATFDGSEEILIGSGTVVSEVTPVTISKNNVTNSLPNGTYAFKLWLINDLGSISAPITKQLVVNNGDFELAPCSHENGANHVDLVPATCVSPGTLEHYTCPDCGKKFKDLTLMHEVTDMDELVIPIDPDAHTFVYAPSTPSNKCEVSCSYNGDPAYDAHDSYLDYFTLEAPENLLGGNLIDHGAILTWEDLESSHPAVDIGYAYASDEATFVSPGPSPIDDTVSAGVYKAYALDCHAVYTKYTVLASTLILEIYKDGSPVTGLSSPFPFINNGNVYELLEHGNGFYYADEDFNFYPSRPFVLSIDSGTTMNLPVSDIKSNKYNHIVVNLADGEGTGTTSIETDDSDIRIMAASGLDALIPASIPAGTTVTIKLVQDTPDIEAVGTEPYEDANKIKNVIVDYDPMTTATEFIDLSINKFENGIHTETLRNLGNDFVYIDLALYVPFDSEDLKILRVHRSSDSDAGKVQELPKRDMDSLMSTASEGFALSDDLTIATLKLNKFSLYALTRGEVNIPTTPTSGKKDRDKDDSAQPTTPSGIDEFFVDVADNTYYYDAVKWAVAEGITSGTDAKHFSPTWSCTRAQMVTFLWRAAGSPAPKSIVSPFTDITSGAYYYDAVLWAAENGYTLGTSETEFSPDLTVTRAQTVTFLWRIAGQMAQAGTNPFADVKSDKYYHDAVLWAALEEITEGTGATTFSPDDFCQRAQIVTFLYRYYN